MKLAVIISIFAVLLPLALAQPVSEEPLQLQATETIDKAATEQVDQAKIESEVPSDVEVALAQFLREEARKDVASVGSHSRQKRASCRCYRRARNVIVCYCR